MSKKAKKQNNASGCRPCDVCGAQEFLEEHHIRGRDIPKAEHPSNIANICPNCHFKVHLGEIILENWMQTTSGRYLIWHNKGESSVTGDNATPHIIKKS